MRLADVGYDRVAIKEAIDEHDWLALYRMHEFVPPDLTITGGRTVTSLL